MRIVFRECRFCPYDLKCEFRDSFKSKVQVIGKGMTALIRCSKYKKVFSPGDKVEIDMRDMSDTEQFEDEGSYSVPPYYTERRIRATGIITGKIDRHGLYQIKLDEPAELYRISQDKTKLILVQLTFYRKRAGEIRRSKDV